MKRRGWFVLSGLLALWYAFSGGTAQGLVGQVSTRDVHALLWLPDGRIPLGHHDGLQVSEDQGQTWRDLVRRVGFDAMYLVRDGERILAAGHWVYAESRDGGRRWRSLSPKGLPALDLHGYGVLPGRVPLVLEARYGYFRSQDGGRSFVPVSPKGLPRAGMAAMQALGQELYVAPMGQGLYRSQNGGLSFERVLSPEQEVYVLAAGGGRLYLGGRTGLWERTSAGWRRVWQGAVLALAVHPEGGGGLVWVDERGRIWRKLP